MAAIVTPKDGIEVSAQTNVIVGAAVGTVGEPNGSRTASHDAGAIGSNLFDFEGNVYRAVGLAVVSLRHAHLSAPMVELPTNTAVHARADIFPLTTHTDPTSGPLPYGGFQVSENEVGGLTLIGSAEVSGQGVKHYVLSESAWLSLFGHLEDDLADKSIPRHVALKVFSLAALRSGWDGFNAQGVTESAILRALAILQGLFALAASHHKQIPAPDIGATADGAVHLEWEMPDSFLSVSIPGGKEGIGLYGSNKTTEQIEDTATVEEIWAAIRRFVLNE